MSLFTIIENATNAIKQRAEATTALILRVNAEDRVRPLWNMDYDEFVSRIKEHPIVYVPGFIMAVIMWLAPYAAAATIGASIGYARLWWVAQ